MKLSKQWELRGNCAACFRREKCTKSCEAARKSQMTHYYSELYKSTSNQVIGGRKHDTRKSSSKRNSRLHKQS